MRDASEAFSYLFKGILCRVRNKCLLLQIHLSSYNQNKSAMSKFYIKIDDDLEQYLSRKEDAEKFVNECIRTEKQKEEKLKVEDNAGEKTPAQSSPAEQMQPKTKPENDSDFRLVVYIALAMIGVVVFIVIFAGIAGSNSSLPPASSSAEAVDSPYTDVDSIMPASSLAAQEAKSTWDFSFEKDPMTGSKNIWARIISTNEIEQGAPYFSTNAIITIRYMKKWGYDALIRISSGQIYGNEYSDENYVMVRFDDDKPIKYWFNEAADGSSESVFIRKKSDFIARCKKAKRIKVEVPLYQGGRPIFEFSVDEPLKWRTE